MPTRIRSIAVLLLAGAGPVTAQSVADRIMDVRDGTVRFAFGVRDGICGDGETFIRDRSQGEGNFMTFEDGSSWRGNPRRGWRERPCEPGPARVAITKDGGAVTRIRLYVGGDWTAGSGPVTDLGMVAAPEAARALVSIARRSSNAEKAVFAATIADSAVVWPDLLALARDDRVRKDTRKTAIFWLSHAAGDEATRGLTELAEGDEQDREIRDQAVFAISQLDEDRGVPILIRIAKENPDPKIRRKALFWLGQSDDPRALRLFEEILTKGH
jgi:hypothetical protein